MPCMSHNHTTSQPLLNPFTAAGNGSVPVATLDSFLWLYPTVCPCSYHQRNTGLTLTKTVLLLLRVYAMYEGSRQVLLYLLLAFVLSYVATFVIATFGLVRLLRSSRKLSPISLALTLTSSQHTILFRCRQLYCYRQAWLHGGNLGSPGKHLGKFVANSLIVLS